VSYDDMLDRAMHDHFDPVQSTPTTDDVREVWVDAMSHHLYPATAEIAREDFDRWLAAHDAELARAAKAEVFDEGARAVVELLGIEMVPVKPGENFADRPVNPYRNVATDE
jgi:hypothetical protein